MPALKLAHADIPKLELEPSLLPAVERSIAAMDWLTDADMAVAELARVCAAAIDAAGDGLEPPPLDTPPALLVAQIMQLRNDLRRKSLLERVGPELRNCLDRLYATPAARDKQSKGRSSKQSNLSLLRGANKG